MSQYKEILLEYWRAGKIKDAVRYLKQWKQEGLLSEEDAEQLEELFPDSFERLNEILEKVPRAVFDLFCRIKEERKWDDHSLCENLGISKEDLGKIKKLVPTSGNARNKIRDEYYELLLEKYKKSQ